MKGSEGKENTVGMAQKLLLFWRKPAVSSSSFTFVFHVPLSPLSLFLSPLCTALSPRKRLDDNTDGIFFKLYRDVAGGKEWSWIM